MKFFKKGAILIELLLTLAVCSAILAATGQALFSSSESNLHSYQNQQAQLYLQEASEIIKSLAATSWQEIMTNDTYYPQISGENWQLQTGQETLGIFKRQILVADVFRDASGGIATQGGILDPSSKKITVTVSWEKPRDQELSKSFLVTRWRNNASWQEDTLSDFSDGLEDATDFTSNPGFIQIAQTGGAGEWTEPTIITDTDAQAKINGLVAKNGYLYAALGSSAEKIEVFDIASEPATPSSQGAFTLAGNANNLAINTDYLYVALEDSIQVVIFDLSSNPIDPPSISSFNLGGEASGLWVQNNYLFVAIKGAKRIEVYDLTEPSNPSWEGKFNTPQNTVDLSGSGNYLYVAQAANQRAIEVFDISTSVTEPVSLGGIPSLYQPTGIWVEGNNLYLSLHQKRAAMYNLSYNPTQPYLLGIFQTNQNTSDVTALGDYGYVSGGDSWQRAIEVIYIGESKGLSGIYFVYGEYISSTWEASSSVAFNRIFWEGEEVINSNIILQIATNNDNFTWNFVGPDGTSGSYFEAPGAIPLQSALAKYLKYKIILTGDSDSTPKVDRVSINYSL